MDVFEAIHNRRSIRKFLDIPVPWDNVVQMLLSGIDAPSPGNLHNYKIVVVRDEETIKKLAEAALQQYWIETAKVILVVCDEPDKIERHYGERGKKIYSIQGCAAMMENMILSAHALGLASCWVGAFEDEMVRRVLNIPENNRIMALLPVGYPDEVVPKPQRPLLEKVVFIDNYGKKFDMDKATGYWSGVWEAKAKKGKKEIEKNIEKTEKKLKKEFKGVGEKLKEKISELKRKLVKKRRQRRK